LPRSTSPLPSNYNEMICSVFNIVEEKKPVYIKEYVHRNPVESIDEIEIDKMLSYISSDCSYEKWIAVGAALYDELKDAGFSYFQNWSSTYSKYNLKTCHEKWSGVQTLTQYTIGTLVYFAKEGGYKPPFKERAEYTVHEVEDLKSFDLDRITARIEAVEKANELPDWYNEAPPLVKDISDWIISTARYPQPIITMGAVMCFLGYAYGKEFNYKGTKGNIYNINLARTGHGKDHIIKCLRGLAKAIEINDTIGTAAVTADTSIYEKIKKSDGKRMYMIDEVQGFIKVICNSSGNAREAGISGVLLQAFSAASIQSPDKANEKDNPTITIENPFISLLGFCTPEPFYDSVNSNDSNTGFLGRLSIFKGELVLPKRNYSHDAEAYKAPPSNIVARIKTIMNNKKELVYMANGLQQYSQHTILEASKEADKLCEEIADEIDDKRRQTETDRDFSTSNLLGRCFEVSKKYMIIASEAETIQVEHVLWAKKVMEYNIGMMFNLASNMVENNFDRVKRDLVDFIRLRGGSVDKTVIARNFKKFRDRREKTDVLNDLLEGAIIKEVKEKGDSHKPRTLYVLNEKD
jgi:hypothetical protein